MKTFLKSRKARLGAALTAIAAMSSSVAVQAADYTADIGTAATDGSGNVTATIAAVITIAILGFGVNAMITWFKK